MERQDRKTDIEGRDSSIKSGTTEWEIVVEQIPQMYWRHILDVMMTTTLHRVLLPSSKAHAHSNGKLNGTVVTD